LLVRLVDTAAVAQREADALVVVAHDGGDAELADEPGDLVGEWPVADEVAQAHHVVDVAQPDVRQHSLQGRQVAVDVAEHRQPAGDSESLHGASLRSCPTISECLS
jgi:hypothetical protein